MKIRKLNETPHIGEDYTPGIDSGRRWKDQYNDQKKKSKQKGISMLQGKWAADSCNILPNPAGGIKMFNHMTGADAYSDAGEASSDSSSSIGGDASASGAVGGESFNRHKNKNMMFEDNYVLDNIIGENIKMPRRFRLVEDDMNELFGKKEWIDYKKDLIKFAQKGKMDKVQEIADIIQDMGSFSEETISSWIKKATGKTVEIKPNAKTQARNDAYQAKYQAEKDKEERTKEIARRQQAAKEENDKKNRAAADNVAANRRFGKSDPDDYNNLHYGDPRTKHESYKSRRRFVESMEEKELLEDQAGQLLCNLFEDMGVDHELACQFSRFEDVVEWIADVVMQLKG